LQAISFEITELSRRDPTRCAFACFANSPEPRYAGIGRKAYPDCDAGNSAELCEPVALLTLTRVLVIKGFGTPAATPFGTSVQIRALTSSARYGDPKDIK
jgi:hypothetical protein